jgi:predicted AlkP superfamily pyrophosphatase or phosphodiesterase
LFKGPIVAVARESYVIAKTNSLKGNHGFDNQIASMRAIFLARGPDFIPNKRIAALNNVDVYPLLCFLIDMECHPNNGTISYFLNALTNPPDPKFAPKFLNLLP